jgi:flagellar basal-body rod protein FlgB
VYRCGEVASLLLSERAMIEAFAQSGNYQLAQKLLDASVLRHEAIATNIANAETPGFRRLEVAPDFAATLRARFAQQTGPMRAGELNHLRPQLVEDTSARVLRPDGNSVELETELLSMSQNFVQHEFLTDLVSRHIKQLKVAITGRVA